MKTFQFSSKIDDKLHVENAVRIINVNDDNIGNIYQCVVWYNNDTKKKKEYSTAVIRIDFVVMVIKLSHDHQTKLNKWCSNNYFNSFS